MHPEQIISLCDRAGLEITEEIQPLVIGFAIRNAVIALVLLLAVGLRTPGALFVAVSGRLINELLEVVQVLAEGAHWGLMVLLVLIVPAVLVLWKLWPLVRIEMATARTQSA